MTRTASLIRMDYGAASQSRDYDLVRRGIQFLSEGWVTQPDLDALARHLGLEATECQKLFKRWCGLSPKEFVQAITLDHARSMLSGAAPVLVASHEAGLSGGGRLHDLFVTWERMTPGDVKRQGAGLEMRFGFHATPFGEAVAVAAPRGLAALAFVNEDAGETRVETLDGLKHRWPFAHYEEDTSATAPDITAIFGSVGSMAQRPIRLVLIGTDWEVRVWDALLKIPMGRAVSYGDVAHQVCTRKASRAVGTAVGKNPISFVVPCHRVMRSDGGLGGYHWGLTRKKAIIGWEAGRILNQLRSP